MSERQNAAVRWRTDLIIYDRLCALTFTRTFWLTPRSIRRQTWTPNVSIGAPCCPECRPEVYCFRAITAVRHLPQSLTITLLHASSLARGTLWLQCNGKGKVTFWRPATELLTLLYPPVLIRTEGRYILPGVLSFFRALCSEVTEQNSSKLCSIFVEPDMKMVTHNVGFLPL